MKKVLRRASLEKSQIICDNCLGILDKESNYFGNGIKVIFPYPHVMDEISPELCSDNCVIEYFKKIIKKHNSFQHPIKSKMSPQEFTKALGDIHYEDHKIGFMENAD